MVETADRKLSGATSSGSDTSLSIGDVKREIHDTRVRLGSGIARTTGRLQSLLSEPVVGERFPQEVGALGMIVASLQAFPRVNGLWTRARAAGNVRTASVAAAVVGIAAMVAVRARRRRLAALPTAVEERP